MPASWSDGSSLGSRTRNCRTYDVAVVSYSAKRDIEDAADVSDKSLVPQLVWIFICRKENSGRKRLFHQHDCRTSAKQGNGRAHHGEALGYQLPHLVASSWLPHDHM